MASGIALVTALAWILAAALPAAADPGGIDDVIAFHQRQVAREGTRCALVFRTLPDETLSDVEPHLN